MRRFKISAFILVLHYTNFSNLFNIFRKIMQLFFQSSISKSWIPIFSIMLLLFLICELPEKVTLKSPFSHQNSLIQRIFSIPTDTLLIVFLKYSQELRDFCGFDVVPDGSKFTRFKQDFLSDLQSMFDHLVDLTEPICQSLNPALASMTIFDTSGIEAWVTENNPKYANSCGFQSGNPADVHQWTFLLRL